MGAAPGIGSSDDNPSASDTGGGGDPGRVPRLTEGVDFYMEKGRFVLTEHFLRKRGFCCRNGCRHCPYGYHP